MTSIAQPNLDNKDNQPDITTMTLEQILSADNWRTLIRLKFPGCDLSFYRIHRNRILSNAAKQKQQGESNGDSGRRNGSSGKPSRKVNYAAQVLSSGESQRRVVYRAMGELVERVNEEDSNE